MENSKTERRAHKRVFFTLGDDIPVFITNAYDTSKTIPASLLSIGKGGISFIAKRHDVEQFIVGDRLIVRVEKLPPPLISMSKVESVIIYIIDIDVYARVSIGCKFVEVNDEILEKIGDLVAKKSEKLLDK